MRAYPATLLRAMSDATIGTAIVMVHLVLADRERSRVVADRRPRMKARLM
jgi:hypothetical protein